MWASFSCLFLCLVIFNFILDIMSDGVSGFCYIPPKRTNFVLFSRQSAWMKSNSKLLCFSPFRIKKKPTIYLLIHEQQKCISHSSWGGKSKIKAPVDTMSGKACFLVHKWSLFHCVLTQYKEAGELSGVSFIRALILFMRVPPSWSNRHPIALLPYTIILGNTFQNINLGEHLLSL